MVFDKLGESSIAAKSMNCPKCQSPQIIKYGHTHYGKPRFRCQDCGRQFVEGATRQPIDEATRQLIDKLLLERLALAAIARVTGVSQRWLQMYVNQKFYQTPKTIEVTQKNGDGWQFNWMRCGLMLALKQTNNGFG